MRIDHQSRLYTKMPWGKYKGIYIKDLPTEYIKWAVLNYTDRAFATWFAEELVYREPKLGRVKS
jgi:hypothetical protein